MPLNCADSHYYNHILFQLRWICKLSTQVIFWKSEYFTAQGSQKHFSVQGVEQASLNLTKFHKYQRDVAINEGYNVGWWDFLDYLLDRQTKLIKPGNAGNSQQVM